MNLEKANEIMNCECLQGIIKQDEKRHNFVSETSDLKITQTPISATINFFTNVIFHNKKVDLEHNYLRKNIRDNEFHTIPFLHCPICGTKTKQDIPEDSFYHKFQK